LKVPIVRRDFFFSAHVDVAAPKALASDRFKGTSGPYVLPVFKLDGTGRQLENGRMLTLFQERQQHDLPIWEFQRIMMVHRVVLIDLPEDCGLVVDSVLTPRPQTYAPNFICERQLRSGQYANRHARIFWRREACRPGIELTGSQLVANLCRPRFDVVKAVITHLATPTLPRPRISLSLSLPWRIREGSMPDIPLGFSFEESDDGFSLRNKNDDGAVTQIEMSAEQIYGLKAAIDLWQDRRSSQSWFIR
jgi:hypothetical protein